MVGVTEAGSIAVRVQSMTYMDQVLVLTRLAEQRLDSKEVTSPDVQTLYDQIRLPRPFRIRDLFRLLEKKGHVRAGSRQGLWMLTPRGRERSMELVAQVDFQELAAEAADGGGGAEFGHTRHTVVPPDLAPPGLIEPLQRFLKEFPFETNVFGMTRFPADAEVGTHDPLVTSLEATRDACKAHGLHFHLAADRTIHDDLWSNVAGHMWASKYGIAFFEDRRGRGLNYNLTIEVGAMLMAGRRCALVKDSSISELPTDLVGRVYKSVDLTDGDQVSATIHGWLREDLRLGECPQCSG